MRELRADAYLGVGNTIHAISEMRALTKLTNDNTDGFFKLSTLYYQVWFLYKLRAQSLTSLILRQDILDRISSFSK